ncbi:hypothetical protein [Sphingopyxis sp. BSNA05]|uniref:hypothetical protein n=1 Tax=Sphingopyxis sp. BSNA05 TaxID=1236614 RepID=UPI001563FBC1|nr:hypothetical protein [Sphingopyxis sp. BSNA05]
MRRTREYGSATTVHIGRGQSDELYKVYSVKEKEKHFGTRIKNPTNLLANEGKYRQG